MFQHCLNLNGSSL